MKCEHDPIERRKVERELAQLCVVTAPTPNELRSLAEYALNMVAVATDKLRADLEIATVERDVLSEHIAVEIEQRSRLYNQLEAERRTPPRVTESEWAYAQEIASMGDGRPAPVTREALNEALRLHRNEHIELEPFCADECEALP